MSAEGLAMRDRLARGQGVDTSRKREPRQAPSSPEMIREGEGENPERELKERAAAHGGLHVMPSPAGRRGLWRWMEPAAPTNSPASDLAIDV